MGSRCPPEEVDGVPVLAPSALAEQVERYESIVGELAQEHGSGAWTHLHGRLRADGDLADLGRRLFRDSVWTRIEWSRALGRPAIAEPHEGFDVQLSYLLIDGAVGPDGRPINTSRWVEAAVPALTWDGPHDDETLRVSVMVRGQSPWLNWIGVALRPGVGWTDGGPAWLRPQRRVVYPSELAARNGVFELEDDGITTLGTFRVVPW